MTRSRRLRLLLLCAASALASASLPAAADELADAAHAESGAAADGQTPRSFDIPAQDLGSALRQFALQSSQQILFSTDIVQGKSTQELKGSFTPDSALAKLLAQSGLASSKSADGSLLISIAGPGETSPPIAAVSEVTVSARRAQLQPRVQEFVVQIAALDGGGGLARWQTPVCPLETGLSKEAGEFVLERISEIARRAGVPLAPEHCRANLFVFLTIDPTRLLQSMEKRDRAVTFGNAEPRRVDEFIATPRAAKVWYDSVMETADNIAPPRGIPSSAGITGPAGQPGGVEGGGVPGKVSNDWERSSHVARTTVRVFSYVYVVIDLRKLQGVTRGQLADYVAMVGLAQIKPGAQSGDAPTILNLFDGEPRSAPPGMTEWDQAFLRSLYTVEPKVTVQRSEIALEMVRQIVR